VLYSIDAASLGAFLLNHCMMCEISIMRVFRWSRACAAVLFLSSTLMIANVLLVLSQTLALVSQRASKKISREIGNAWWSLCVWVSESWYGIRPVFSGDQVPARENVLLICNHQQMPDILFLFSLAIRKGRLGDTKWFLKSQLRWVPGIGWGLHFLDALFVKRDWNRDRAMIDRTFEKFIRLKIPLWLISFVEGTRITPEKLRKSQEFQRTLGSDPLQHVLYPRTKGFIASVQGLRSHLDAVYDVTLAYPGGVPHLADVLLGHVQSFHLHLKRYEMPTLPESETDLSAWLVQRFREKDSLLERFRRSGSLS
jgi:lysocardiolipin and lysophospholipid acyltransferase